MPAGAAVGLTGLEREFDERLTGTPGGVLFAGERVLANVKAKPGSAVRTTIDPKIQRAAVDALAGRYGGIAVVRPAQRRGAGARGHRPVAPQPPGSTFKIVTLAGVLENKIAKRNVDLPVQNAATIEGVEIQNANGESCGGSLEISFAHSCNSVFAPLGAKLGAEKLVETAEKFGFNEDPPIVRRGALARSPPRARSATTSPSARPRSARARCSPRRCRWRSSARRSAPTASARSPTLLKGADPQRVRATLELRRPHDQELHAHRRDRRHRRRRGARRHQGLGQDRHGRAAHDGQGGAAAGGHRPRAAAARGRRDATPTPGSSRSRPTASRRSPSR